MLCKELITGCCEVRWLERVWRSPALLPVRNQGMLTAAMAVRWEKKVLEILLGRLAEEAR